MRNICELRVWTRRLFMVVDPFRSFYGPLFGSRVKFRKPHAVFLESPPSISPGLNENATTSTNPFSWAHLPFGLKWKWARGPVSVGGFCPEKTLRPMFERFLFPLLLVALAYAELADLEDECWGNETCSMSLRQLRGSADGSKTKTKKVYRLDVTCHRRPYFLAILAASKRNAL